MYEIGLFANRFSLFLLFATGDLQATGGGHTPIEKNHILEERNNLENSAKKSPPGRY